MRIAYSGSVDLDPGTEFSIVRKWVKEHPAVIKQMLEKGTGNCSYGTECKKFPCETLFCRADHLENGYPAYM